MGLSRNKVAVSEGAAGSPPFYGECVTPQTRELRIFDWFDERPKNDCCSIFRIKTDSEKKKLVSLTQRVHLFPFRTQKLSFAVPTILCGRLHGKIGRCQHHRESERVPDETRKPLETGV